MTDWQWKVILALIRVVLKIEQRTNDDSHEWFDLQTSQDVSLLQQAVNREQT